MKICNGLTSSVKSYDDYLVINPIKDCIIESASSEERAIYSVNVLNEHEMRYGREPIYIWQKRVNIWQKQDK
jgi:hypothetical protein